MCGGLSAKPDELLAVTTVRRLLEEVHNKLMAAHIDHLLLPEGREASRDDDRITQDRHTEARSRHTVDQPECFLAPHSEEVPRELLFVDRHPISVQMHLSPFSEHTPHHMNYGLPRGGAVYVKPVNSSWSMDAMTYGSGGVRHTSFSVNAASKFSSPAHITHTPTQHQHTSQ